MYRVDFTTRAKRDLRKLSDDLYIRIRPQLKSLAENPRPHGCIKIVSAAGRYRIRIGDYRVL
ncbi:MAG: type II toxin-antitoxin system RelE/ParE family toxin [Candidatus Hatepunaea meridiana]|nr:type II toxin-antitoxin system RelE/ParE family toxin [Candidatus Hatepunaea meridiana]